MPAAEFLARLGLFVRRGFLETDACERLREHARSAETAPGLVEGGSSTGRIDSAVRRTAVAYVTEPSESLLDGPLEAMLPEIELHYGVELRAWTKPQFLVYREGDFFTPHQDRKDGPDADETLRRRRVSAVIFLNGQSAEPAAGCYGGGEFTFYGLLGAERGEQVGIPLTPEPGLLVAFQSDLVHGVARITHGERYTVVTWLV
jgi:SM-20-related protein